MRYKQKDRKTVLLIEDDRNIYLSLKMIFAENGHKIIHAPTCMTGLRKIQNGTKVDLIILDIVMPTMNGISCLDVLKETRNNVPVVILSALDRAGSCSEAFKKGARDYITKPFDAKDLREKINAILFSETQRKRTNVK